MIKRREFLTQASMGMAATRFAVSEKKTSHAGSSGGSRVAGERYEAVVPDTLNLAHRAELALHILTTWPDPECEYGVGCGPHGIELGVKFAEALPMARAMSGSDLNLEVDKAQMDTYLSLIGEDGLLYTPNNSPKRRKPGGSLLGLHYGWSREPRIGS